MMDNVSFEAKANSIISMLNGALEGNGSIVRFVPKGDMDSMKKESSLGVIAIVEDKMLRDVEYTSFNMSDEFYGIFRKAVSSLGLEDCVRPKNNVGNSFSFIIL